MEATIGYLRSRALSAPNHQASFEFGWPQGRCCAMAFKGLMRMTAVT